MKRRTYPVQKSGVSPYTRYKKAPYFYASEDRPKLKDAGPSSVAKGKNVRHQTRDVSNRFQPRSEK